MQPLKHAALLSPILALTAVLVACSASEPGQPTPTVGSSLASPTKGAVPSTCSTRPATPSRVATVPGSTAIAASGPCEAFVLYQNGGAARVDRVGPRGRQPVAEFSGVSGLYLLRGHGRLFLSGTRQDAAVAAVIPLAGSRVPELVPLHSQTVAAIAISRSRVFIATGGTSIQVRDLRLRLVDTFESAVRVVALAWANDQLFVAGRDSGGHMRAGPFGALLRVPASRSCGPTWMAAESDGEQILACNGMLGGASSDARLFVRGGGRWVRAVLIKAGEAGPLSVTGAGKRTVVLLAQEGRRTLLVHTTGTRWRRLSLQHVDALWGYQPSVFDGVVWLGGTGPVYRAALPRALVP